MGFRDRVDPGQERAIMPRLEINASNVVGRRGGRFSGKLFFYGFKYFLFSPQNLGKMIQFDYSSIFQMV